MLQMRLNKNNVDGSRLVCKAEVFSERKRIPKTEINSRKTEINSERLSKNPCGAGLIQKSCSKATSLNQSCALANAAQKKPAGVTGGRGQ
jgi:hypothetical protein